MARKPRVVMDNLDSPKDPEEVEDIISKKARQMSIEMVSSDAEMMSGYPNTVGCDPFKVSDIKTLVYAPSDDFYYETLARVCQPLVDFDVNQMSVLDFDHLVFSMRVNSCGESVPYSITCADCGTPSAITVECSKFNINCPDKKYSEILEVNPELTLRWPRMKDQVEYSRLRETRDLVVMDSYAKCILQGNSIEDKLAILDDQAPMVLGKISKYADEMETYGIQNTVKFKCSAKKKNEKGEQTKEICGREELIAIPFRHKFFLPGQPEGDK